MTFYFGAHISSSGNLVEAAKSVKDAGGNFIQLMLTGKGSKLVSKKSEPELHKLKKFLDKNSMKIVIHSSYAHNLAREWDRHSWWLKNIELEIKYAHMLGAIGLVIHFGKQLDLSIEESYNNMYTSLVYINSKTSEYKDVKIFLETPTGQGTEVCYKLEDLAYFYKKFSKSENKELKNRIKLCIDTCHIFSAGYDIRSRDTVKLYLEAFEELIGLRYVFLIHLNDCKVDIGDQKDRHAEIGKGYIGYNGLKHFFKYFQKLKVPIILETPNLGYLREISMMLKS